LPRVGFDEPACRVLWIEFEVVLAHDVGGRLAEEACGRLGDQHVAAVQVLHDDGIRRGLDDGLQDVGAVGNGRHAGSIITWGGRESGPPTPKASAPSPGAIPPKSAFARERS